MNRYLASYLLYIGFKKMFRKVLENTEPAGSKLYWFLLLELWFVYHFPGFLQFFDVGAQS